MKRAFHRRRLFSLVLLFFFAAPAFAAEPSWVEVKSPNFQVFTDAGEKRGRDVALHFEQMRFAFGKLFQKAKVQTGVPVRVIAFRNSKEFRSVAPVWKGKARDNLSGYYLGGDSVAFVALDLSSPQGWQVVFHEYAHLLLNSNVGTTPAWFDEGFAEFYSTTQIEKNEWVIGSLPEYAPQMLMQNKFIPLVQLFSAGHDSPLYNEGNHVSMFYAESWLAIEYFFFVDPQRQKQLMRYLELTQKQVPVPEAMRQAFGKDPAELDKDLEKYFREGKAMKTTFKSPPALDAMEMKVTALSDLDARASVAELRLLEEDYKQQAQAELESILQQKPDQPAALRGLGYAAIRRGDLEQARTYLDKSVALGGDDASVYYYWALAVQREGRFDGDIREKMRKALEKAIALDPQMSDAYSLLAFVQMQSDFEGAIKSMKTAIALSPRKPENYLNMANLYMSRGKFDDAAAFLQQVMKIPDQRVAAQAKTMLADIERMKRARDSYSRNDDEIEATATPVELVPAEDSEVDLKSFSGTLAKIECKSTSDVTLTVTSGGNKLVLKGNADEMMVSGKDFSCDLKDAKVHGHYNAKNSTVLTLVVE